MRLTYDAIVIGAGVNGLALSIRLQRAGLKTLVVESSPIVGGMARTEEPLIAGFRHNPHANYLAYGAVSPLEKDFGLALAGLVTITPDAQHGMCFEDGHPPLVIYRDGAMERTVESIAQYSVRDGETYATIKSAASVLDPLMEAGLYAPPTRKSAELLISAAETIYPQGGGARAAQSARQLIDDLFEADAVRAFFYQLSAETGIAIDAPGGGVGFLTFTLWVAGQWRLPVGGMQAYSNALAEAARRAGVELALNAEVERIVVKGGEAKGVVLAGFGEVGATGAVASSAGLHATLVDLTPDAVFSRQERASIATYQKTEGPSLGTMAFCLRHAPDYSSARWNPDINRCFRTVIGYGGARETLAHLGDIERGALPPASGALRVNTLWDNSQSPAGLHVAGGDVLMPAPSSLDAADWEGVSASFIAAFQSVWERHAANMTEDNILASQFTPPQKYDRALRLGEGSAQYRTEVKGLYLCGASTYPGGGVHGACGYNAFEAIAEDLEL